MPVSSKQFKYSQMSHKMLKFSYFMFQKIFRTKVSATETWSNALCCFHGTYCDLQFISTHPTLLFELHYKMRRTKFKYNKMQNTNKICAEYQQQGGRSWRIFANLTQHNMQYIPCKSALLARETLFLTQKGTFFCPKISKKILLIKRGPKY